MGRTERYTHNLRATSSLGVAARIGDGYWGVAPDADAIDRYRHAGGTGPRYAQLHVCWAEDPAEARKTVHHIWPTSGIHGQLSQDLPTWTHFEEAATMVTEEEATRSIPCGPDVEPFVDSVREFVAAGNFYWNSGIFVWKAQTILDALAQHEPEMHSRLATIAAAIGTPAYQSILEHEFAAIQGKSIDYAVMEHARDVLVIEAPFRWDDVGSWQSLARLRGKDEQGNTLAGGQHIGLRTRGTIVRSSDDHLIVTLGIVDCIVVHTPDATLVANKHDEESIRDLVRLIAERGWNEYL